MASPSRSGVFEQRPDPRVDKFTESVSFDQRLYAHDIEASQAHAAMLASVGLISEDEGQQIIDGLDEIRAEIERGDFELHIELEDIHMHIESRLIERLGDVGRKLHTARSRNDQVSTDLRMWVRDAIEHLDVRLLTLQSALVARCERDMDVVLPAYTHLQRAQPVLAPHYWLAYCEKFQRDRERLADCAARANVLSLGIAAVAGTTLPIDREFVRDSLEFDDIARNSLDVSSDRDFVLEFAFVMSLISEHLSGWAEEWILWSTVEFNFIQLPQEFCTGSSIMPQKVNPDCLELIRGKTARVIGNLTSLLMLVKGLPLAYNRDLQEDKPSLFDSFDTVDACLELAAPMIDGAELNRESIESRLDQGFLDATTLMEYLIRQGVAQRNAHHAVGALVRQAMQANCRLSDLALADFQAALNEQPDCVLDDSVFEVLGTQKAIESFTSYGSTAPGQVALQVEQWRGWLEAELDGDDFDEELLEDEDEMDSDDLDMDDRSTNDDA